MRTMMGLALAAIPVLGQSTHEPYTFSTLAGHAHTSSGSADGTGSAARFRHPLGVTVDEGGDVYVADSENDTIRKVTPSGVVTTLAGNASIMDPYGYGLVVGGYADGTGGAARFDTPTGVAVDRGGNVYVADTRNCTVRRVTPAGVVTTLAGNGTTRNNSGWIVPGSADGTGSAARFWTPSGVAVDSAGNIYVADTRNHTIRKVTAVGVVTTLAGLAARYAAPGTMGRAHADAPQAPRG